MLDPRQLTLLQEIARAGSYSAAGRTLGFTQPAITYQMRCLEREVGAPLTVRTGRTMQLTETGRALLVHAERILSVLRAAEDDMRARRDNGAGRIRLAAFPSSCATVVPAALVGLRETHPNTLIELVQAEPPQARELIRRGEVDVALTYRLGTLPRQAAPTDASGLAQIPVLSEQVHLVLPMDHAEAGQHMIDIGALRDDTFIIAGTHFGDLLHRLASRAGFTPRMLVVADDYVVMQAMAAAGFGVSFIPDLALRAHRDPRIVSRSLRDWPQRHIQVELWPDTRRVDAVQALVERLTTIATARTHVRRPA